MLLLSSDIVALLHPLAPLAGSILLAADQHLSAPGDDVLIIGSSAAATLIRNVCAG